MRVNAVCAQQLQEYGAETTTLNKCKGFVAKVAKHNDFLNLKKSQNSCQGTPSSEQQATGHLAAIALPNPRDQTISQALRLPICFGWYWLDPRATRSPQWVTAASGSGRRWQWRREAPSRLVRSGASPLTSAPCSSESLPWWLIPSPGTGWRGAPLRFQRKGLPVNP